MNTAPNGTADRRETAEGNAHWGAISDGKQILDRAVPILPIPAESLPTSQDSGQAPGPNELR